MSNTIKVAVNGYGVIGKRVADAVRAQEDMELLGVSDVTADYRVATAITLGIPVYASVPVSALIIWMLALGASVSGAAVSLAKVRQNKKRED